jgi:DNA-binding transcriptional MerR regulator
VLTGSAQSGDYPGAPNGRVRELPDQRMIRWYTSTGIVDRPFGGRGRGARYGVRHLRQLVAVKQLQAQGLQLADIQVRLAGVADDELARLVPLPPEAVEPAPASPVAQAAAGLRIDRAEAPTRRFWAIDPAPVAHRAPDAPPQERLPVVHRFAGLELAPGALLVLPETPDPDDVAALAEAARPLVDALIRRGLIPRSASPAEPTEGASR